MEYFKIRLESQRRNMICLELIYIVNKINLINIKNINNNNINNKILKGVKEKNSRGESAGLGRRMRWASRLFSKSMKGKILNFLHKVEKIISVISVQV